MIKLLQWLDWKKLKLRERALFIVTGIVVLWVLVSMMLMPKVKQVKQYRTEIATLRANISRQSGLLPSLRTSLKRLRSQESTRDVSKGGLMKISDVLQGGTQLSSFLEELNRLARLRQVEIVSIRPEGFEDKEAYLEMNFRMDLKSRFRHLGEYLMMLENLPRAIIVNDIKIESSVENNPYIIAQLKAATFMAKE